VQKAFLGLIVTLTAVSCAGVGTHGSDAARPLIRIEPTASPFLRVTSGAVSGLVPHGWRAVPLDGVDYHEGFVASPRPRGWPNVHPSTAGIAATYVDATRVGVPSDLYYLAATGPVLEGLRDRPGCTPSYKHVFVNHIPSFLNGPFDSVGDYVASWEGVCRGPQGQRTRWSYFVAAPGYGPAGRLGIPGSGLYLVVASMRESPQARGILAGLLDHVRFGRTDITDFERAVHQQV